MDGACIDELERFRLDWLAEVSRRPTTASSAAAPTSGPTTRTFTTIVDDEKLEKTSNEPPTVAPAHINSDRVPHHVFLASGNALVSDVCFCYEVAD